MQQSLQNASGHAVAQEAKGSGISGPCVGPVLDALSPGVLRQGGVAASRSQPVVEFLCKRQGMTLLGLPWPPTCG